MGFQTVLNRKHVPGAVNGVQIQNLSPGADHIDSVHVAQVLEQVSGASVERIHSGLSGIVQNSMRPNNLDSVHVLDQFSGITPRENNAQDLVQAVHVQSQRQRSWNSVKSSQVNRSWADMHKSGIKIGLYLISALRIDPSFVAKSLNKVACIGIPLHMKKKER
ncbi:uncharacterized protein A4U43_C05F18380 [Asparagus officinalis]|uniref:Uncharacterized protein n=1 Tax=Asparagus officinalis TaxID=4686 RepID=A0A5P1ET83_ASPOF|nr:uncharacterized protein A4U43_C05F18380 [Asparagus officinalis]